MERKFEWPRKPKWRVEVGTHQSTEVLVGDVLADEHRCIMTDREYALVKRCVKLEKISRVIDLVEIDLAAAGFMRDPGMSIPEIYKEVLPLGYALCPHETALQFRRQRLKQNPHTLLLVASDPFPCSASMIEPFKSASTICSLSATQKLSTGNFVRWLGFETTLPTYARSKDFGQRYPNLPPTSMLFALPGPDSATSA